MPRPENVSPYHQFAYTSGISSVRSSSRSQSQTLSLVTPITLLNMLFLAIAGGLILYYVMQANAIAADHYTMQSLNAEVQSLSEVRMDLAQQQTQLEDASLLVSFATMQNMVEAKGVSYLFESSNVAYHR